MSHPIEAVLIGAGNRGADAYGAYALAHPDEIRFVAVAEPHDVRRARFAQAHAIPPERQFGTWEDLLAQGQIADAAFVCTLDRLHVAPALAALEAGYDVLLEKPMATTEHMGKSANQQIGKSDAASLASVDTCMQSGVGRVSPAAVLHVRQAGTTIFERAYGYLDPQARRHPTRPASPFDLASLTKLFTATAFMALVEARRVALETPVAEVLPEFAGRRPIGPAEDPLAGITVPPDPQFAGQEVDAGTVTFWHLLTHTSGLAAWRSLYREEGGKGGKEGKEGEGVPLPHQVEAGVRVRRIAAIYEQYGFAYPPGERVVYSDLGFIVLGEAVARLAGMPLEACMRQAVLEPLGLRTTTYNPLVNGCSPTQIVPTELCAWRQRRCIGEVHDENSAGLGGVAGHAGLFSTAAEVATLGQLYLNGGIYNGTRLLRPETVAEMVRVQAGDDENPRGLGWLQRSASYSSSGHYFGPRSFGHTGFTGTSLWVDPDRQLVVALLTNRVYYGRDPEPIQDFRPRLHDAVVMRNS